MTGPGPLLGPETVQALLRREREALAGRLLRGVVHNFSGALQLIRLPLDILEMRLGMGQGLTEDISPRLIAIHNGYNRVAEELELLAGKSGQAGQTQPVLLDLAAVAREQLGFWRADMYFKHQAQVATRLEGFAPRTRAAYADVALAFNVLVANAVEALAAAGRTGLSISLEVREGMPALLVADDAPPPSPEMAPAMFAAFSGDKGGDHDGLGLFLANAALAPWQGRVVYEDLPAKGFLLTLPPA
ncbi:MAG: ATP-binding protein [Pseudomonadota bacterium]